MKLSDMRKSYKQAGEKGLRKADLAANPMTQFNIWFEDAKNATQDNHVETNAMTISTVNSDGQPSSRIVLLKELTEESFIFYSNYTSHKAQDITTNPKVALNFYWYALERQIRIEGLVEKVSRKRSERYFKSRPYESQLGAWASEQSSEIANQEILVEQMQALRERFSEGNVPLPEFWGGYAVKAVRYEFWQGRPNRLHDRFEYSVGDDAKWYIKRLAP